MSDATRLRPAIDPGSADFAALREQHFHVWRAASDYPLR